MSGFMVLLSISACDADLGTMHDDSNLVQKESVRSKSIFTIDSILEVDLSTNTSRIVFDTTYTTNTESDETVVNSKRNSSIKEDSNRNEQGWNSEMDKLSLEKSVIDSLNDSDKITNKNECIIIVGAFAKSMNAKTISEKIEKLGYQVYRDDASNLVKIGLYSSCESDELEKKLIHVRSKIARDAYALK